LSTQQTLLILQCTNSPIMSLYFVTLVNLWFVLRPILLIQLEFTDNKITSLKYPHSENEVTDIYSPLMDATEPIQQNSWLYPYDFDSGPEELFNCPSDFCRIHPKTYYYCLPFQVFRPSTSSNLQFLVNVYETLST
jgi:hypothetical protein